MKINIFNTFNEVYYKTENGDLYRCFLDKEMEKVEFSLSDIMVRSHKDNINYALITELQVNILKEKFKKTQRLNLKHFFEFDSIEAYYRMGIIPKEEFNKFKLFLKQAQ